MILCSDELSVVRLYSVFMLLGFSRTHISPYYDTVTYILKSVAISVHNNSTVYHYGFIFYTKIPTSVVYTRMNFYFTVTYIFNLSTIFLITFISVHNILQISNRCVSACISNYINKVKLKFSTELRSHGPIFNLILFCIII